MSSQANGSLKTPQINAFSDSTASKKSSPASKGVLGGLFNVAARYDPIVTPTVRRLSQDTILLPVPVLLPELPRPPLDLPLPVQPILPPPDLPKLTGVLRAIPQPIAPPKLPLVPELPVVHPPQIPLGQDVPFLGPSSGHIPTFSTRNTAPSASWSSRHRSTAGYTAYSGSTPFAWHSPATAASGASATARSTAWRTAITEATSGTNNSRNLAHSRCAGHTTLAAPATASRCDAGTRSTQSKGSRLSTL